MSVAVISNIGERLMPTSEYRARKLLKSGKAVKCSYHPFTIQLTERKAGDVQPIELCMDTGYIHIGISVKSEKHEYLAEQIDTLTDERARHDACRMYRRQRRGRKDTASRDSITGKGIKAGLPHRWSIKKISTSRQSHASIKSCLLQILLWKWEILILRY